jgi:predicted Fe-S protein YdhL (DUF1289 family)
LWKSLEPSPEVHSPCTGSCTLNDAGLCPRCGRTISEIANWMDSSNEEKAAIVRAANGRRDGAG